jgi:hypothetical protein
MTPQPVKRDRSGLWIALAFFSVSVLTIGSYGLTWDEGETSAASLFNVRLVKAVLTGHAPESWAFHEWPGYYFIIDLIRGAFVWLASHTLRLMDQVLAFHLVNIVMAALSVFVFYLLARNVSGTTRVAGLSTMALVTLPQFVAHSQNNPKDLPGVFVYVLAIYTFTRLETANRRRDVLYAGLALGLALTTTVSAILLVPILAFWKMWSRSRPAWTSFGLILVIGAVTACVCWPWLWRDPIGRMSWAVTQTAARFHITDLPVLYLGTIYQAWELPWHYSLVSMLAVTPVLYLLFAMAAFVPDRSRLEGAEPGPRRAVILGLLWLAIPIAAEMRAPMHYDGARHLLMTAPALCLLAGTGLDSMLRWFGRRPVAAMACAAAVFAYAGTELIRLHPYHNAYLNEIVRTWVTGHPEDTFEIEYWGQSHKEGAQWLNAHAEPGADIYVGLDTATANHYLARTSRELDEKTLPDFEDQTRAAYFMVMTRKAMYSPAIEHIVNTYEPVFVVRRHTGTLLKVFFNRRLLGTADASRSRLGASADAWHRHAAAQAVKDAIQ